MKISILIFIYTIKKNEQNIGTDKQYGYFFGYTIQLITIKLCTKFQNPKSGSC